LQGRFNAPVKSPAIVVNPVKAVGALTGTRLAAKFIVLPGCGG